MNQRRIQNPLTMTDSYKQTHWKQYPPGTQRVYSYLESRGGFWGHTKWFGLQYHLKAYLEGQFYQRSDIKLAAEEMSEHFGQRGLFNTKGWADMYEKYGGALPLSIRALPEGTVAPTHTVLETIEGTDDEFAWLTNWIETILLEVWYPTTVATLGHEIRRVIGAALEKSGDPTGLPFKLHDFGYRGVSSQESAAIGGLAHLTNFLGTDTLASLSAARQYYNHKGAAGFSIPASEHSTMTSWGEANEIHAFENMLTQYPEGLVACVSDQYDILNACEKLWGGLLRDKVMGRKGTLVIRPDSGDPVVFIPKIMEILAARFGLDEKAVGASKGYKVLAPCVRVIQGDGVNYHSIQAIVNAMLAAGWSMDNLAFGMGGALLQQLNRDTLQFAFKCSAIKRNNVWHDVFKRPATDPAKNSKRGRFVVTDIGSGCQTSALDGKVLVTGNLLQEVFRNGKILVETSLDEVRERGTVARA
jgi:nicotinamide phosphoribosyltransferase